MIHNVGVHSDGTGHFFFQRILVLDGRYLLLIVSKTKR